MFMLSTFLAGRLEVCRPPKKFETGNTKEATTRMSTGLSVRRNAGAA